MKKIVIYYSKSGTTEKLAKRISDDLQCDIIKIVPKKEYGNYFSAVARVAGEKLIKRIPEFTNEIPDLTQYDTIILGYPIWYSAPPQFLLDFLKKCDLCGKTVIPFSTSGGSSIGVTINKIKKAIPNVNIVNPYNCSMIKKDDYQTWISQIK